MKGRMLAAAAVVVAFVATVWLFAGFAGPVAANHDSPGDWTIQPAETPEDRQPGYESASYIHWAQGGDDFRDQGLEEVHHIEMVSEDISFDDCSLFDVSEFGIDRGGNNEGTETDDDLAPHVKHHEFAEDRMWMELYQQHDAGGSPTNLDADDVFVAHQLECYTNPDEAGWYQIEGWANGTAYDGEYDEAHLHSHYFWIGDFDSEEEAREELGPPPSEQDDEEPETPEPEADDDGEAAPDDADGDGADDAEADDPETDNTETDDAGADDAGAEDPETDDDAAADAEADDDAEAADDTEAADDAGAEGVASDDTQEPADADGPGFGAFAALAALLAASIALRRR